MNKNLEEFVCEMADLAGCIESVYRDDTGAIVVDYQYVSVINNMLSHRTSTYPELDWDTAMRALPQLSEVYAELARYNTDPDQPMLVLTDMVGPRVVQVTAEHADGYTQRFIAHQDVRYLEFYEN